MGHFSSRHNALAGAAADGQPPLPSRFSRFRTRLRLRRRDRAAAADCSESGRPAAVAADEFAGIARIRIIKEKKVVIETNGPHIARISVFETNRFSKNTLVGYCEVDLFDLLTKDLEEEHIEDLALLDPSSSTNTVGTISISCYIEDPVETEQSFARRVLAIVDYDEDGKLSLPEFSDLMKAFGNGLAVNKMEELFRQAGTNGDGIVDMDELAALLADQQEKEPIISNCPVCGESLGKYDKINDMIHMTLCFDEGTGNQIMTGGFLTDKQASYGWMFKLSEWANFSSYDVGLRSGSTASHILVCPHAGVKDILKNLSEKQGKKMNSPESAKDIPKFLDLFMGQINMDETKDPIESFKTFNDFFVRQLKPSARPIAYNDQDNIATCAADCRLMAFSSVDESTRFWIKVNPIAVNSKYCNVFTKNKRVISIISTSEFGKVAFVAIGATMVGSITFLKKEGDYVHKGDEFGYFSFGGSTVICIFEKDAIQFDADLVANSERSLETLVEVGMTLGTSKRNRELQVPELQKCSVE
ncbi:hypothetical protein ACQ4PT_007090 [Festuca glaucescens]